MSLDNYVRNKFVLVVLDVSGSMQQDQYVPIIDTLKFFSDNSTIFVVPVDCQYYWKDSIKLSKNLNIKQHFGNVGRGGTDLNGVDDCLLYMNKPDTVIFVTDGWVPVPNKPKLDTDVLWLMTENNPGFKPSFGKSIDLFDELDM